MAYLVTKKVKGNYYAYLQESYRESGTVKTRTVEYLGAIAPAVARQITTTKAQANKVKIAALVESVREAATASIVEPAKTKQIAVNDSPALVDSATGELIKTYDKKVITTENKAGRPFSKSLELPSTLEKYGISKTALLHTHARYGRRLEAMEINPSHMTDVKIKYGHPDKLERSKKGYTVFVSRRTQNVKHKANKSALWKHYRQALTGSYLEAIERASPEQFNELKAGLDYYHKDAKRLLFESIKAEATPAARLGLSLQLYLWDKLPGSITQKSKPADFGQVDFSTLNDWRGELTNILSEVQKSGWDGLEKRQKNAKRKAKATITKKLNELKGKSFLDRAKNKLSGKRRRLIREIMAKEKQLQAIEHLEDRLKTIKRVLPF